MTVAYQNAINGRVYNLLQLGKGYTVAYDNAPFVVPENQTWFSVEIHDGIVGRTSLGPTFNERSVGTVFFTIYSPKSTGSDPARKVADDIIAAFRSVQFATSNGIITFYNPTVKRVGEAYASGAGSAISATVASTQWYQLIVQVPFKHDEVVSVA